MFPVLLPRREEREEPNLLRGIELEYISPPRMVTDIIKIGEQIGGESNNRKVKLSPLALALALTLLPLPLLLSPLLLLKPIVDWTNTDWPTPIRIGQTMHINLNKINIKYKIKGILSKKLAINFLSLSYLFLLECFL